MAFVWDENISLGAPTNAAGLNELQDNLDTIYAGLNIKRGGCASGAGWTEFPITGGLVTDKLSDQAQELRVVTDYAHDNKCPAHDSGYKSGVDTSENTGYDSSYKSGVDTSENTGYNLAHQIDVSCGQYFSAHCPADCPAYYLDYKSSDYADHKSSDNADYKSSDYDPYGIM